MTISRRSPERNWLASDPCRLAPGALLADHNLGGFDDHRNLVALFETESLYRTPGDGGDDVLYTDVNCHLGRDGSQLDPLDHTSQLIAGAELHPSAFGS